MNLSKILGCVMMAGVTITACKQKAVDTPAKVEESKTESEHSEAHKIYPEEQHFKTIKQLTFGGDNAEAYWSYDNKTLVFQATNEDW